MSIAELKNDPLTLKLGDGNYKVARLSVGEIFSYAQNKVREEYLKNISEVAKCLSGKEKIEYLNQATKDIPRGEALFAAGTEYLETANGVADLLILALTKYQNVSQEEISSNLLKASDEERLIMISYISGSDSMVNNKEASKETKEVTEDKKK